LIDGSVLFGAEPD